MASHCLVLACCLLLSKAVVPAAFQVHRLPLSTSQPFTSSSTSILISYGNLDEFPPDSAFTMSLLSLKEKQKQKNITTVSQLSEG
jgi:hypothetical protein